MQDPGISVALPVQDADTFTSATAGTYSHDPYPSLTLQLPGSSVPAPAVRAQTVGIMLSCAASSDGVAIQLSGVSDETIAAASMQPAGHSPVESVLAL